SRSVVVSDPEGDPIDFLLDDGKRQPRRYRGVLRVSAAAGLLQAEVSMSDHTVVACKLASIFGSGVPLNLLGSVASRLCSALPSSRRRHAEADYCDTVHCDLARDCPLENAPASVAAQAACSESR